VKAAQRLYLDLPTVAFEWSSGADIGESISREWIVTNGLGGYASSTVACCNTRRYHSWLVASLPGSLGRTVVLPRMVESIEVEGETYRLDCEERSNGQLEVAALTHLIAFRLGGLTPEWEYALGRARLLRRLVMVHGENTIFLGYEHLEGPAVQLSLRPFTAFRPHDTLSPSRPPMPSVRIQGEQLEVYAHDGAMPLRLRLYSECPAPFVGLGEYSAPLLYRLEKNRGLDHSEQLVSAGFFQCALRPGSTLAVGATTDGWEALDREPGEALELELEREHRLLERAPRVARQEVAARLLLAVDQFIIDPRTRPAFEAPPRAAGQDARSVIAGYHWFTEWGRDTMISLEGLALATHRVREAAAILRTFRHYVRDGLLPNLFPEGGREGLYHTADATLWFFHAVNRYLTAAGDWELVRDFFPTLQDIIDHHVRGTRFGIGVDPVDGLLRQGAPGYQLTWMDAKVDDWVVTPRRGKAVEINALWFNALRLMAEWARQLGDDGKQYLDRAEQAQVSFNRRFWNPGEQCLFDVVDGEGGDDAAVRPNQIFALSLDHPVLRREKWEPVLEKVSAELLTPVGLRSLSPSHADYKPIYDGGLRARDAAYHQGTVWAWLIGHFIDAWLRAHPDKASARTFLAGLEEHLFTAGVGQVSEIFDASPPYRPCGCIAQAWSVAEMLRSWLKTA